MKENLIRVAVIGYGHLGKWHCEKVEKLDQSQLVAIVDHKQENLKLAEEKYPNAIITSEIENIIDSIDAAIIVVPTVAHFSYVEYLLKAGKHLFCEKPLVTSYQEAKKSLELFQQYSKERNIVFQVGHSERFHPGLRLLRHQYKSYFDQASLLKMYRLAPFKGRATDVDVVSDLMIHDLDLMLNLYQEFPHSVFSIGHKSVTHKWDFACSSFHFPSGRSAILQAQRDHSKEVRQFEVVGHRGLCGIDLLHREIYINDNKTGKLETHSYEKADHLLLEQEEFYKAIINNSRPIIDVADGAKAVYLVDKVIEGLETQKIVIIDEKFN